MAKIKRTMTASLEEFGKKAGEYALNEFEYNGLTIRQWADKITSGEYQPVKHGRWKWDGCIVRCTVCNERPPDDWQTDVCPNCGAIMDGDRGVVYKAIEEQPTMTVKLDVGKTVPEISEIEKLAMQWIYDLRGEYRHLQECKKNLKNLLDDWQHYMRVVIESEKYMQKYRYVSQLCYAIGGTVLYKFKELVESKQFVPELLKEDISREESNERLYGGYEEDRKTMIGSNE